MARSAVATVEVPPAIRLACELAKPPLSSPDPVADVFLEVFGPRPADRLPPPEVVDEMKRLGLGLEEFPWWGHPDLNQGLGGLRQDGVYQNGRLLGQHFDAQGWPTVAYLQEVSEQRQARSREFSRKWEAIVQSVAVGHAHAMIRTEIVSGLEAYVFTGWRPTRRESLFFEDDRLTYNLSQCRPSVSAYSGQWFATDGVSRASDEGLQRAYAEDPQAWILREFGSRWKRPWWLLSHEPDGTVLVELGYVMKSRMAATAGADHRRRLARGRGYSLAQALEGLVWRVSATDERRALRKGCAAVPQAQSQLMLG